MEINDNFFMQLAINAAWKYQFLTYPNPPVGACVVGKNGEILSIKAHKKAGKAHAEVRAIKEAYYKLTKDKRIKHIKNPKEIHQFLYANHKNIFQECKIYTTLEPCNHYGKTPPCALLIGKLGFKEVIIGALDHSKAGGGAKKLEQNNIKVKYKVLHKECKRLIEPFMNWNNKRFIFFKHAQTLNGTIDGGYISDSKTLKFVHHLRDKIDLIVIGGNSVRIDRPRLNSRLVKGKNPDVLIYSRSKNFDKTIPLFDIKDRKVFIDNKLDILQNYNFIMVEGAGSLYEEFKDINWHLSLISGNIKRGKKFEAKNKEKIIHTYQIGNDLVVFTKRK
jgi:diaminohydroxyphosphoribosylaminopyrimidine deaminase/5-amino-6-(5-phosphoribosylamino)uracil reductase